MSLINVFFYSWKRYELSDSVSFLCSAPSEAPTIVEVRPLSATEAIVCWMPVNSQTVEGYQVDIKPSLYLPEIVWNMSVFRSSNISTSVRCGSGDRRWRTRRLPSACWFPVKRTTRDWTTWNPTLVTTSRCERTTAPVTDPPASVTRCTRRKRVSLSHTELHDNHSNI